MPLGDKRMLVYLVVLLDIVAELAFHVAVGTQGLDDVAAESTLGVELDGREPPHVVRVEKHETNNRLAPVNFERMTA